MPPGDRHTLPLVWKSGVSWPAVQTAAIAAATTAAAVHLVVACVPCSSYCCNSSCVSRHQMCQSCRHIACCHQSRRHRTSPRPHRLLLRPLGLAGRAGPGWSVFELTHRHRRSTRDGVYRAQHQAALRQKNQAPHPKVAAAAPQRQTPRALVVLPGALRGKLCVLFVTELEHSPVQPQGEPRQVPHLIAAAASHAAATPAGADVVSVAPSPVPMTPDRRRAHSLPMVWQRGVSWLEVQAGVSAAATAVAVFVMACTVLNTRLKLLLYVADSRCVNLAAM
jgi:hypothetical protein